jgi:hypothetical protein
MSIVTGSDTEGSGDDFAFDFDARGFPGIVNETPLDNVELELPSIRSNPLLLPTARQQADFILNSAQVSGRRHDARRRTSNMVQGNLAALYPHLERYFDGADLDACARIDWMRCSGEDLWNVLTSKHLACGKAANASMSLSFRFALKKLKDVTLDASLKARFEQALSITNDKHPSHASLRAYFVSALQNSSILNSVCDAMASYHRGKKIHIKDNGLFPKFTEVQCNMVRVALFMASASAQPILHAISNPDQSRSALDNPETRVVQSKTALYQQFTDLVNSDETPDRCIVDMTSFNGILVDCTCLQGPPMPMVTVSCFMRDLKRDISMHMVNFEKSGEGVNGADDFDRDIDFYDNFVKGDPLLFAVYLAWNHGRNIPAWNSTLLPPNARLDVGVSRERSPPRKRARASPTEDMFEASKLEKLIEMQSKFYEVVLGGKLSHEASSSVTTSSVDPLKSLEAEISVLQRLRADATISADMKAKINTKYDELIEKALMGPNAPAFLTY